MKCHLIESPEPLKEGGPLTGICGVEVNPSKFALVWDSTVMGDPVILSTLLFCRKCAIEAHALWISKSTRYLYGIVQGDPCP
jgi:hypothetical protein